MGAKFKVDLFSVLRFNRQFWRPEQQQSRQLVAAAAWRLADSRGSRGRKIANDTTAKPDDRNRNYHNHHYHQHQRKCKP